MKLTLRPLIFISHFIPGFFLSSIIFMWCQNWDLDTALTWIKPLSNNQVLIAGILFVGSSFLAGELLDAIRDAIFENTVEYFGWKIDWSLLDMAKQSAAKNFEENYFTWYVFDFNASLSLVLGWISLWNKHSPIIFWIFLLGSVLLLANAISLRREMVNYARKPALLPPPHFGVFARLAPSSISGVGVFAILDIPKGSGIFYGDDDTNTVTVQRSEIAQLPPEVRKLYEDFCPLDGDIFTCPINFNALTPSWYLNESKTPNIFCGDNLLFYALRDIKKGEELTVDYSTYSDTP